MSVVPTLSIQRQHSGPFTRGYEALAHMAVSLVTFVAWEIRVRRDMRKLAELDEWMLRDIGLTRTEIERSVRHGRSRDGF